MVMDSPPMPSRLSLPQPSMYSINSEVGRFQGTKTHASYIYACVVEHGRMQYTMFQIPKEGKAARCICTMTNPMGGSFSRSSSSYEERHAQPTALEEKLRHPHFPVLSWNHSIVHKPQILSQKQKVYLRIVPYILLYT
jgi:hypothetical protein